MSSSPTPVTDGDQLTIGDLVKTVRQRWYAVAAPIAVFVLLAILWANLRPATYEAEARVLIGNSAAQEALNPTFQNPAFLTREISNEISFALSDDVVGLVETTLSEEDPEVEISGEASSDVLVFTTTGDTPELAAARSNAWANAYVSVKRQQASDSIASAVDDFRTQLEDLRNQRNDLLAPVFELEDDLAAGGAATAATLQRDLDRLNTSLAPELGVIDAQIASVGESVRQLQLQGQLALTGTAQIVQVAAPPEDAAGLPIWLLAGLGVFLGSLIGLALVFLFESLDAQIRTPDDVTDLIGIPVLGSVPKATRRQEQLGLDLILREQPDGPISAGYYELRSALQYSLLTGDFHSLLITSANASEGKSTTAANIAYAFANAGRDTMLVDVDFRRPRIHSIFGLRPAPGLADLDTAEGSLERLVAHERAGDGQLRVLPTGTAPLSPDDFFARAEFLDRVETMESAADFIVFDAPPVLPVPDSLTVARHTDATLVVVRAGRTKRDDLLTAYRRLRQNGANVIGAVIIGANPKSTYGSAYYAESKPTGSKPRRSATTSSAPKPSLTPGDRTRRPAEVGSGSRSTPPAAGSPKPSGSGPKPAKPAKPVSSNGSSRRPAEKRPASTSSARSNGKSEKPRTNAEGSATSHVTKGTNAGGTSKARTQKGTNSGKGRFDEKR